MLQGPQWLLPTPNEGAAPMSVVSSFGTWKKASQRWGNLDKPKETYERNKTKKMHGTYLEDLGMYYRYILCVYCL